MRSISILYAEDNPVVLDAVRETLELEGWQVEACTGGAATLSMIESGSLYDALLLDDDLPEICGIALIRRARSLPRFQRTPILMLSASDSPEEALRAGADAFLHKPRDISRLVETLKRLLDDAEGSLNASADERR
jgi:CheY-like chemotaxis protein